MQELMLILLVISIVAVLLSGYPVALAYAGVAILFTLIGNTFFSEEVFDGTAISLFGENLFTLLKSSDSMVLLAVPVFVFMGVMLEKSKVAENLLNTMGLLFGSIPGGLGLSVLLVGMLLAASTGIVGATVVTMGLLSLPTMLQRKYDPQVACGTICASGTLGQIIPPSIVLILLGFQISNDYNAARNSLQENKTSWIPDEGASDLVRETVSIGDLFVGALIPGLLLVFMYAVYLMFKALKNPQSMPPIPKEERTLKGRALAKQCASALFPPLMLIVLVLGSILAGIASPFEAASVGAVGAIFLALINKTLDKKILQEVMESTLRITSMVFMIIIGAMFFTATFKGYGGIEIVEGLLSDMPGGAYGTLFIIMLTIFLLGFILDFIEITLVVLPIVTPVLFKFGFDTDTGGVADASQIIDPLWFGVLVAVNLQTSFMTPPFGFSLFYLRGVAPAHISTSHIYRGVIPFIVIQLLMLAVLAFWPELVTGLVDYLDSIKNGD